MMKFAVVFILAGVLAYTQAQTVLPAVNCAACTGPQQIDAKMNALDFAGACATYKGLYNCNSNNVGCSRTSLTNYVSDICTAGDATLTGCGTQLSQCIAVLQKANAASQSAQKKVVCSDITQFFVCANQALVMCHSKNATIVINQLRAAVHELDLEANCTGDCGAAVGQCLSGVAKDSDSGPMTNQKFQDLCTQLVPAKTCIQNLKQDVCAGSQPDLDAANIQLSRVQSQISDICGPNGTPTACVTGFLMCAQPLKSITAANGCKTMADYLTCAERLTCKYSILNQINNEKATVSAEMLKENCPVTGGCTDRLKVCDNQAMTALQGVTDSTSNAQFCNIASTVESCYTVVRNDKSCSVENMMASDKEDQFFSMFQGQCANSTACELSIKACKKDMASLTDSSSIQDICMKSGKAVGCVNAMIASDVCTRVARQASADDQHLNDVYNKDCGNATACDDGLKACIAPIASIANDPDSAKNKDCPIIHTAVGCIDKMRQSKLCIQAQTALMNGETIIKQKDAQVCGNSGVTMKASILVMAAAFVLSLWK